MPDQSPRTVYGRDQRSSALLSRRAEPRPGRCRPGLAGGERRWPASCAATRNAYYSRFGDPVDFLFASFGIGWHYETGVRLLRLIFSGVLDRHPGLQLIIGHWGEFVLFFPERTAMMQKTGLHLDRHRARLRTARAISSVLSPEVSWWLR